MITPLQAVVLGLLQGVTELFPISSLGHSVILPSLLGWDVHQNDPYFLEFLVATHLATASVLFVFFWKDWVKIFSGIVRSLKEREVKQSDPYAKLGWLLIVGTIPAGVLGLLFEERLKSFFASAESAAIFLTLNGVLLFSGEFLRGKAGKESDFAHSDERIAKLSWLQSLKIGLLQSLALFPGFSRTGATLVGSLLVGLSHEDSLRFSFLLATPVIGAAAVLKIPELLVSYDSQLLISVLFGTLSAGLGAYFTVRFLEKYFQTRTLFPFAIYCLAAGGLTFLYFLRGLLA